MKIAIDLTQIPANKTGVGIYALNLIREMCRLNDVFKRFDFFFFVQDDDRDFIEFIESQEHTTLIPVKSRTFRKMIARFFFEQVILPNKCKKLGIDLIFSMHYTIPYFTKIKCVVAFHDMTFYLFPELHRKVKVLYFKALIPFSVKKSSAVIVVSKSTKTDVLERIPNAIPDKMTVIYHGVDPIGKRPPEQSGPVLDRYGLDPGKYFLFIGTLEPRKNIPAIIKAFHHFRQSVPEGATSFKLAIVGKKGWLYNEIFETVKKLHLEDEVIFTGYVTEESKNILLTEAFLFLYPSFYEGFGIPVLEAMAAGTPVICGNTSSLPEVAGNAAILVPPSHWQEITTAMAKLLSDKDYYKKKTTEGLEQIQSFTWEITAQKTLDLFRSILENETHT